ncbi:CBO0543 family protein [Bacillus sp. CHD6a]|uniref:CBO0543 family protein n=1 Tax=Bacillus sp. CHD6a TaxID=1643452 RepID=UPI0007612EC2|nr:CBO0543 family protein [Bacillus sp. CHD6a]
MEIANYNYLYNWIVLNSIADPRWWLLFSSIFLPWVIWWWIVDKKRLFENVAYGLCWATMATWLDILGTEYGKWSYPIKINTDIQTLLSADTAVIPVMYMLLYQYASTWKTFVFGSVLCAAVFSFIFEPLFIMLDMLELKEWSHTKSFFSFISLAIATRTLFYLIKKKQSTF